MHIPSNDITPTTFLNYVRHPITTNPTPVTADNLLWCRKTLFPIDDCHLLFHRNKYNLLSYRAPFVQPNLLYTHKT